MRLEGEEGREAGQRGLFDQPLGDVSVGDLDLLVTGAGVGELLAHVGVVQVLPDRRHLLGDVEASVLLGHHLEEGQPKLQNLTDTELESRSNGFRNLKESRISDFKM